MKCPNFRVWRGKCSGHQSSERFPLYTEAFIHATSLYLMHLSKKHIYNIIHKYIYIYIHNERVKQYDMCTHTHTHSQGGPDVFYDCQSKASPGKTV